MDSGTTRSGAAPTPLADDLFEHVAASPAGDDRRKHILSLSAEAIGAFYRFIRTVLVHDIDNDAVAGAIDAALPTMRRLAEFVDRPATFTFVRDTIFVCDELLKASRGVYEAAAELGAILRKCDVTEISIEAKATPGNLRDFGRAFRIAHSDTSQRSALLGAILESVHVRQVHASLEARDGQREMPVRERVLSLYATALVVLRTYLDAVARGRHPPPIALKRLGQRLVELSETGDPALLGMTTMANAHRDDAGRALQSAILAIALGRTITSDRLTLSRLALAALMSDVGRVRLAGTEGRDQLVALEANDECHVPATTAAICIATGGVNDSAATRTMATYEATWLEREDRLGPIYGGAHAPSLQAQLLRSTRALLDHLAPRTLDAPQSPLDALESVLCSPFTDPVRRRILVAALGVVPTGTVVELDSGEWGVVIGLSGHPEAPDMPRVRVVTDDRGRPTAPPYDVDLGHPAALAEGRHIARIVEPDRAQFNAASVFVR